MDSDDICCDHRFSTQLSFFRENNNLSEKNNDQMDKIKSLEDEIRQMKKSNNDYIEKLTNKNCNIDNIYDQK